MRCDRHTGRAAAEVDDDGSVTSAGGPCVDGRMLKGICTNVSDGAFVDVMDGTVARGVLNILKVCAPGYGQNTLLSTVRSLMILYMVLPN